MTWGQFLQLKGKGVATTVRQIAGEGGEGERYQKKGKKTKVKR